MSNKPAHLQNRLRSREMHVHGVHVQTTVVCARLMLSIIHSMSFDWWLMNSEAEKLDHRGKVWLQMSCMDSGGIQHFSMSCLNEIIPAHNTSRGDEQVRNVCVHCIVTP